MRSVWLSPYFALRGLALCWLVAHSWWSLATTRLTPIGYMTAIHSFEVISRAVSLELEKNYELFLLVNTAEGPTPPGAFLPNQHMLVVAKSDGQETVFERNPEGRIQAVKPGSLFLSDLMEFDLRSLSKKTDRGLPFEWDGMEVLPVSTGTRFHLPTFSGIFQLNWDRSLARRETDFSQPMSNALYVGYYYHDESVKPGDFSDHNRERVSYLAVHGTPKENWKLLGRSRASHGCSRSIPEFNLGLFELIKRWPEKEVINLDWDYELPVVDRLQPRAIKKPVLIILYNGETSSEA